MPENLKRPYEGACSPIPSLSNDPQIGLVRGGVIVAISALILGFLVLSVPSAGLKGLNALAIPGGSSLIAVGAIALFLTTLRVCYLYKKFNEHNKPTSQVENSETWQGLVVGDGVKSTSLHPTPEELEKQKTTAASQIQSAYRRHRVRLTLKERVEQRAAAISIQSAYRRHLAQSSFITLKQKKQEQQKLESEVKRLQLYPKTDFSAHLGINRVESPTPKFSSCTVKVTHSNRHEETILIHNEEDIELMIKKLHDEIYRTHESLNICVEEEGNFFRRVSIETRMRLFQNAPSAAHLQLSLFDYSNISIYPKPAKIEDLGDGSTRYTYINGTTETFLARNPFEKSRIFPDGKREKGEFGARGRLTMGYRIGVDQRCEFVNPKSLASYYREETRSCFMICEVEEKLVVLEQTRASASYSYVITDISPEAVLLKTSLKCDGQSIRKVLVHKDFEKHLDLFMDCVLGIDELGIPRLFSFSKNAVFDLLELGLKNKIVDPLKIVDPVSKRNLFMQAVYWKDVRILSKLIELFPHSFQSEGQAIIVELLQKVCSYGEIEYVVESFKKLGGHLDLYHNMWLQVAQGHPPSEAFKNDFKILSSEQKRTLYDVAFAYDNPFIYEPPDLPVKADQYSINLMWINKHKMPAEQEFLFGDGDTAEQRRLHFHEGFVIPVAKWAQKNPGTSINIWVDSEMATAGSIERSQEALLKALEGTDHGEIHFRDVRPIGVVCAHPKVFNEMPIYFRVDLLRAIAADHVLRLKETQYFVYGDIDKDPISAEEIFDKRTLNFLDDFGFVMAKGGSLGFENGFQILNGSHLQFMESHRKVIIDLSIEMALQKPREIKEQQIYDTYPAMITHLLDADGRYGKLNFDRDPEACGIDIFRRDQFRQKASRFLPLGNGEIRLGDIAPTKPVSLPPSHF